MTLKRKFGQARFDPLFAGEITTWGWLKSQHLQKSSKPFFWWSTLWNSIMWLKHVKTIINHPINRRYKQFPNNRFLETQMLLIKSPLSGEPKFLEVQSPMAPIPTAETSGGLVKSLPRYLFYISIRQMPQTPHVAWTLWLWQWGKSQQPARFIILLVLNISGIFGNDPQQLSISSSQQPPATHPFPT